MSRQSGEKTTGSLGHPWKGGPQGDRGFGEEPSPQGGGWGFSYKKGGWKIPWKNWRISERTQKGKRIRKKIGKKGIQTKGNLVKCLTCKKDASWAGSTKKTRARKKRKNSERVERNGPGKTRVPHKQRWRNPSRPRGNGLVGGWVEPINFNKKKNQEARN